MKIDVLAVGKVKEKYFVSAIDEYVKRLGRYCRISILEAADEKTPDGAPEAVERQIRDTEGARILQKIAPDALVCALAIDGRSFSSEEFAGWMEKQAVGGTSHIQFIIGGSLGLSEEVLRRADVKISFSAMTFPHQLMRVILLEQIYRGFRIIHGEPYHK